MRTHDLYLQSLGVYLPADRVTTEQALESDLCDTEFEGSDLIGVPVADAATTFEMAVEAARLALREAGRDAGQIDLLIYAPMFRQGPDGWSPVGYILRELGCRPVAGHEVNQGCNGVLAALEMAAGWLALAPPDASALVTTALNAGTPWLDRWRSPGFGIAIGDGAGAFVLGKGHGVARIESVNSLTFHELEALHRGSLPLREPGPGPRGKIDVTARVREYATGAGSTPVDFHRNFIMMYEQVARRSLDDLGIDQKDLARVIFSNVGADLTDTSVMRPLGLPMSLATWDFGRTIGHVGGSDHLAALDHLLRTRQLGAGDRVLLVSGTAGYNVASAVLTVTEAG